MTRTVARVLVVFATFTGCLVGDDPIDEPTDEQIDEVELTADDSAAAQDLEIGSDEQLSTLALITGCSGSASMSASSGLITGSGKLTCNVTKTISATTCIFQKKGSCYYPYYCNEQTIQLGCTTVVKTVYPGQSIYARLSVNQPTGTWRYVTQFYAWNKNNSSQDFTASATATYTR